MCEFIVSVVGIRSGVAIGIGETREVAKSVIGLGDGFIRSGFSFYIPTIVIGIVSWYP